MNYTVIYKKEKDWGYTTHVVELDWCISYGTDLEDAQKMTKEAIECYLESVKKHKEDKKQTFSKTFISTLYVDDIIYA